MNHSGRGAVAEVKDEVRVWMPNDVAGLELMHASLLTQSFPKHMHDTLSIAVTDAGSGRYSFDGADYSVAADDISFFNPGEVHTERPTGKYGWVYRTFFIDANLLEHAAEESGWSANLLPTFPETTVDDRRLASLLRNLHCVFEQPSSRLERESWVLWALSALIQGYAAERSEQPLHSGDNRSLDAVRSYIDANYADDISIGDLAQLAGLSPTHLIHSFHRSFGIPPIAYQHAVRMIHVKQALRAGTPIAEVALETGFYDQSHLHRVFRRMTGMTPGQYRQSVVLGKSDYE